MKLEESIETDSHDYRNTYHFMRMSKCLYVKLLAEMSEQDVKQHYESFTKHSIKMCQEQLFKIIEEGQMY